MRLDELYKFCDGKLSSVRCVLHDIASNLEMDFLPKRHWSNMEMKRSRIMVKAIDKLLFESSQNWRDLPRDIPLDSVVVLRYGKRSKSDNKGKVLTEMELVLEQTQQGTSYEVSVFPMMTAARRGRRQSVKVKELQDKRILKAFKLSYQEKYEHVGSMSQDHKMNRMVRIYNLCTDLVDFADMALPLRDQRHQYLRFEGLQYTNADIVDFETRLGKIYRREVHRVQVFDFGGLTELMAKGLSGRMLMEHRDAQGQGGVRHRMRWRQFILALDCILQRRWRLLGLVYTRQIVGSDAEIMPHAIACSIAGRSQAPEKVIVTNLFYLRGIDVGSVNVPYLLARYLRLFASGRKQGAMISGGQFVARLAEHFGLLTEERLQRLIVTMRDLPIIDMAELVRIQICKELDDMWNWVASGPKRQPDVAAGAPKGAKDAPAVDEGALNDPTHMQEPQTPHAAPRTMPQRFARIEEEVHELW
ncbi:hypothetical protein Tco_1334959 [Tanacetum coccineum]